MGSNNICMTNTQFVGIRENGTPVVRYGDENASVTGKTLEERSRGKYPSHSVTGFEWGYSGSGPAQLAYCMLEHVYGHKLASRNYMDFKRDFVSNFPEGDDGIVWSISINEIDEFIHKNEDMDASYTISVYDFDENDEEVVHYDNIIKSCKEYDRIKRERSNDNVDMHLKPKEV